MGLVPAKTKFRKHQRGRVRGRASSNCEISFGEFGLQAQEVGILTVNQLEAARKALTHFLKRGGKIWIRAFADKIVTGRPAETRMGGGKGAPVAFVAPVKKGTIIFELAGISPAEAKEALRLAAHKLSVTTRVVGKL